MRKGEVINGYEVVEDSSTKDAGLSEWAFATKDGLDYFIKEFLAPKYPLPDGPGSAAGKKRRLKQCEAFEQHHRWLMDLTQPVAARGGNLIVTLDFFRVGADYYKVTERIDGETLDPAFTSRLEIDDRLVILSATTHSLKILHRAGIVHGDLKPTNVMVKPTRHAYTAKLIDFDNAYLTGNPPPPEALVGTINYYAPEVYLYLKGRLAMMDLTVQADIFALGLIFTQLLTGELPAFDTKEYGRYAGAAVAEGARLEIPTRGIPSKMLPIIESMLSPSALRRPTVDEVHASVKSIAIDADKGSLTLPTVARETTDDGATTRSRLRRSGGHDSGRDPDSPSRRTATEKDVAATPEHVSRLRGKGLGGDGKR